jgi:hypothetical protein
VLEEVRARETPNACSRGERAAVDRLRMAYDDEGGRLLAPRPELLEELDVVEVGQPLLRGVEAEPAELVDLRVDLIAGHVVVADHVTHPVVHLLRAPAADRVELGQQGQPEPDLDPGLLEHLADRGHRDVLARILLALGKRPVVVLGSMDQQHLAPLGSLAGDHGTGGNDVRTARRFGGCHGAHPHTIG